MPTGSVENSLLAALQNINKSLRKDDAFTSPGSSVYERGGRYKIVPTQRHRRKLIDINAGHTYTVKRMYKETTVWRCSMRSKSTYCRATVLQTGKTFKKGFHNHIHEGRLAAAQLSQSGKLTRKRTRAKKHAKQDIPQQLEEGIVVDVDSPSSFREENEELEVPEIIATPGHMESELRLIPVLAAEHMEEIGVQHEADQDQSLEGVVEDHGNVSDSSQRQQPEVSVGSNPVDFLQVAIGQMVGSPEVNVGPVVGSEVAITETPGNDTGEFQENWLHDAEYTIIDGSSQRRKAKLIDSAGYTYTLKSTNRYTSYWRCTIRNKNTLCRASVMQTGDEFRRGQFGHSHPSKPNGAVAARLVAQVKAKAFLEPNEPTSHIIGEALLETVGYYQPCPGIPKPCNLARTANRLKQSMRPRCPDNLNKGSIPTDFLQTVVKRGDKSHILLASPLQLLLLSKATLWYIDMNTKAVTAPLKQLISIHAFVEEGQEIKQLPMAFILMSSRKKKDYKAVFQAIKDRLPGVCATKECVLDYETALWRSVRDVFPEIECSGSAYHWSKAIWKKIQDFGILQSCGPKHSNKDKLLRKLMALAFLPPELIPKMLAKLQEKADGGMLLQLLNYIEATWIEGLLCMWSPSVWSVYMQPGRINNELETWQRQLNKRAKKGELPLSILIVHLLSESKKVNAQTKPASKRRLKRHYGMAGRNPRIIQLWEEFLQGEKKLKQLLSACANLYRPESDMY